MVEYRVVVARQLAKRIHQVRWERSDDVPSEFTSNAEHLIQELRLGANRLLQALHDKDWHAGLLADNLQGQVMVAHAGGAIDSEERDELLELSAQLLH